MMPPIIKGQKGIFKWNRITQLWDFHPDPAAENLDPMWDASGYAVEPPAKKCSCGVWKVYGEKAGMQMHSKWCDLR